MVKERLYRKKTTTAVSEYVPTRGRSSWLVIVESPSKCKKIEEYLGPDYKCIASMGHLRTLDSLESIHAEDEYRVDFTLLSEKKSHVEQMRRMIRLYEPGRILLATDDDREGEAIAWHITQIFGLPVETTPRILFHEITQPALEYAVKHPTTLNMDLVNSQQARQIIDLLVGFKVSPLLWQYVCSPKQKDALSAGRCQTVALRLVHENQLLGQKVSNDSTRWKTTAIFTSHKIPFQGAVLTCEPSLTNLFQTVLAHPFFRLDFKEPVERTVPPPLPLTTARLLKNYTSLSPKTVMNMCQILYQDGHITYMRTDCAKYSPVFLEKVRLKILDFDRVGDRGGGEEYVGDLKALETTGKHPHEAIRITCLDVATVNYTKDPRLNTLYAFIRKNTLQSCMASSRWEDIRVQVVHIVDSANPPVFKYTCEIPTFDGWTSFGNPGESVVLAQERRSQLLFLRGLKSPVECLSLKADAVVERPHSHYTEASLIAELEKKGIGRPSTYAYLVDVLLQRGYVKKADLEGQEIICWDYAWKKGEMNMKKADRTIWVGKEKGKLVIQPVGSMTMQFLQQYFQELFSYDYTSRMENELDDIANGSILKQTVCSHCEQNLTTWIEPIMKVKKKKMPLIDGRYEFVLQSFGTALRHKIVPTETIPATPIVHRKKSSNTAETADQYEYYPVREGLVLDLVKLESGGYTANELLEFPNGTDCLGSLEENPVTIRKGPYGWYLCWNQQSVSLGKDKPVHSITYSDAVSMLKSTSASTSTSTSESIPSSDEGKERQPPTLNGLLRTVNAMVSIRNGKWGPYIMVLGGEGGGAKKKGGKKDKTRFINLKNFQGDYLSCPEEDILQMISTVPS